MAEATPAAEQMALLAAALRLAFLALRAVEAETAARPMVEPEAQQLWGLARPLLLFLVEREKPGTQVLPRQLHSRVESAAQTPSVAQVQVFTMVWVSQAQRIQAPEVLEQDFLVSAVVAVAVALGVTLSQLFLRCQLPTHIPLAPEALEVWVTEMAGPAS